MPARAKFGIIVKNKKNQQVVKSMIVKTQKKTVGMKHMCLIKFRTVMIFPRNLERAGSVRIQPEIKMDTDS